MPICYCETCASTHLVAVVVWQCPFGSETRKASLRLIARSDHAVMQLYIPRCAVSSYGLAASLDVGACLVSARIAAISEQSNLGKCIRELLKHICSYGTNGLSKTMCLGCAGTRRPFPGLNATP